MFARGVVYLHAAHLPVPKSLAAKSTVSVTSKLIEIKGLQLHYFGHLRKTGGRGSYRLVHTSPHLGRKPSSVKSNHSHTLVPSAFREGCAALQQVQSFPHLRDTRGWGVCSYQCVRRITVISDQLSGSEKNTHSNGHRSRVTKHNSPVTFFSPLVAGHRPLVASPPPCLFHHTVPRAYCATPCQNGTYLYPRCFREPALRVCRPYTGAPMPTIDRQELDRLERRNLQLTILSAVFVLILAGGLVMFIYPLVFVHVPPEENKWTM